MSLVSDKDLKDTIFSKNNTNGIYLSVVADNNLQLDSTAKVVLTDKIVGEMKNVFGAIKRDKVNAHNFNKVVTSVNDKVKKKMSAFLSDPKNIRVMQEQKRRMQVSQRPSMVSRHKGGYDDQHSFPEHYLPERYEPDFNSGGLNTRNNDEIDSEESITDRLRKLEVERAQDYNMHTKRPPTPDFSLEPKSKKQIEKERMEKQQKMMKQRQQEYHREQRPRQQKSSLDDFYGDTITDGINQPDDEAELDKYFDPINENFINSQDVDYDAAIDPYTNNVNNYDTGVNPDDKDFDDITSLEEQMKQYENDTKHLQNKKPGPLPSQVQRQIQPAFAPQRPIPQRPQPQQQFTQHHIQQPMSHQQQMQQRYMQQQQQLYMQQQQQQQMQQQYRQMGQSVQTFHPQVQQHVSDMLRQQAIKYEVEITNLKQQLGNGVAPEQNKQIQLLNHELSEQKLLVIELQERLKLNKPSLDHDATEKLKIIESKKGEIIEKMNNLKEKYDETEKIIEEQIKMRKEIDEKTHKITETIKNNLALYNTYDKNEIINTGTCVKKDHMFTHTFQTPINILTAIEINDYSFPEMLHNITPYNNTLYITSEVKGEIICDALTTYKKDGNVHAITLVPGNYTIDYLIECMNKTLSYIGVTMQHRPQNNYISFYSDTSNFSLVTDFNKYKNNMLSILGFSNGSLYNNNKYYTSSKSYDLRADKVITMYIPNLSSKVPFCKFNISSSKIEKRPIQLSKPINNVTHFDLEFKDSKNNHVFFADKDVIIDFTLKMIQTSLPVIDVDEYQTPCKEKDLYEQIGEMLK